MKKSLFLLGLAVAAMTSCTNSEVMEMAEGQAIGFSTFVNNGTKAAITGDVTVDNLQNIWVYGGYDNKTPVFDNQAVEKTGTSWTYTPVQYWVSGKQYKFGAYSNGGETLTQGVTFDIANSKLTLTDYACDGTKDLVSALGSGSWNGSGEPSAVDFTFNHLLSKVYFTFAPAKGYESTIIELTSLKITSLAQKGTANVTAASKTWNKLAQGTDFTYQSTTDFTQGTSGVEVGANSAKVAAKYFIPQATSTLNATVSLKIKDANGNVLQTITDKVVSLDYQLQSASTPWKNGNVYHYTASVSPDQAQLKPIVFTVTTVEGWQTGYSPQVSVPTK